MQQTGPSISLSLRYMYQTTCASAACGHLEPAFRWARSQRSAATRGAWRALAIHHAECMGDRARRRRAPDKFWTSRIHTVLEVQLYACCTRARVRLIGVCTRAADRSSDSEGSPDHELRNLGPALSAEQTWGSGPQSRAPVEPLLTMVPLLLMLSAAGSTNLGELVLSPTPHCQAVMDMWCGTLTQCVLEVKTTGGLLPLVARFGLEGAHEWRCYSPSALDKNGTRYTGGPQFCSEDALLRQVLGICNGSLPQQPYPVPAEGGLPPHSSSSSDCDPSPTPQSTVIMAAGQDSTACFRIPSVVGPFGTDSPSVLVFAEARENSCADAGSYALALVRSEDGSTWPTGPGSVQYLFNDTAAAKLKSDGINLGASVYDAKRKTVHVLFDQCADQFGKAPCGETASLLVMSSRDLERRGLQWSTSPTQ